VTSVTFWSVHKLTGEENGMPTDGQSTVTRAAVVGAVVFALLVAAALAWHAVASSAFSASSTGPLDRRRAAAARASAMEPWNSGFAWRVGVLADWARGQELLDSGDYKSAVNVLAVAYRGDVGNTELLALFKRAQVMQSAETNRKAHLQHGHEGPGGTLTPDQIER
jgi:hypothetical protein